jgi:hypothetical protein
MCMVYLALLRLYRVKDEYKKVMHKKVVTSRNMKEVVPRFIILVYRVNITCYFCVFNTNVYS